MTSTRFAAPLPGDIWNISYHFRLEGDPPSCGYPEYELICENNRTLTINLQGGKYYGKFLVTHINYHDSTIVVVDPGLKKANCWISSPLHSIPAFYSFHRVHRFLYTLPYFWGADYRYNSPSQQTCSRSIGGLVDPGEEDDRATRAKGPRVRRARAVKCHTSRDGLSEVGNRSILFWETVVQ